MKKRGIFSAEKNHLNIKFLYSIETRYLQLKFLTFNLNQTIKKTTKQKLKKFCISFDLYCRNPNQYIQSLSCKIQNIVPINHNIKSYSNTNTSFAITKPRTQAALCLVQNKKFEMYHKRYLLCLLYSTTKSNF